MNIVLLIMCIVFGILRFTLPVAGINNADLFKDLSHLFVGFLFGYAAKSKSWQNWAMAISLTILEIVAFFARS